LGKSVAQAGYFVIHSVALGHFVGFTTSWLWFLFEPLVPAALTMLFGQVLSDYVAAETGVVIPWWLVACLGVAVLTYTSYVGIRQSSRSDRHPRHDRNCRAVVPGSTVDRPCRAQPASHLIQSGVVAAGLGWCVLCHGLRNPQFLGFEAGGYRSPKKAQRQAIANHFDHGFHDRHRHPSIVCWAMQRWLGGGFSPIRRRLPMISVAPPIRTSLWGKTRSGPSARCWCSLLLPTARSPARWLARTPRRASTIRWAAPESFRSGLNHINPKTETPDRGDFPAGRHLARLRTCRWLPLRANERLRAAGPTVHRSR